MSQQAERALILLSARSEADQERPIGGAALAEPGAPDRRVLVERVLNAFADSQTSAEPQLGILGVFGG